jgi:hypothetical protein
MRLAASGCSFYTMSRPTATEAIPTISKQKEIAKYLLFICTPSPFKKVSLGFRAHHCTFQNSKTKQIVAKRNRREPAECRD